MKIFLSMMSCHLIHKGKNSLFLLLRNKDIAMKVPSLLRIPKHQKFHIQPRYYDPVKEEIEQRISRIKNELDGENNEDPMQYRSRMKGAFTRQRSGGRGRKAGASQLMMILVVTGGFVGFLFYGNIALYSMGAVIALYYYLKLRKII